MALAIIPKLILRIIIISILFLIVKLAFIIIIPLIIV